METFAQRVLTLTKTRRIVNILLLDDHAPDELAVIPFALAALSGSILLLLKFAPARFVVGRKSEGDERLVRLLSV